MNFSILCSAIRRQVLAISTVVGLELLVFAPVVAWCLFSGQISREAICVIVVFVSAANAVGVVCLMAASDPPIRQGSMTIPWWVAEQRTLPTT